MTLPRQRAAVAEGDPLPPDDRPTTRRTALVEDAYVKHRASLLSFITRRTSRDAAPDLLHRVFARFLGLSAAKVEEIASPEAYLRVSAANLIRDDHKAAGRAAATLHVPEQSLDLAAPCQIAALEARDMLARIEAVLLTLKPRTREIFLAHRLDGYSYAEIAERTGLSVKGVEKQMSKAIAHIDEQLSRT